MARAICTDTFGRAVFSVTSTQQQPWRNEQTCVSITTVSDICFSLSLCCFARLTTGNKFWEQETRGKDPSVVYAVRTSWASPLKLDVTVGIFFLIPNMMLPT